jgi:hypothetical protein
MRNTGLSRPIGARTAAAAWAVHPFIMSRVIVATGAPCSDPKKPYRPESHNPCRKNFAQDTPNRPYRGVSCLT